MSVCGFYYIILLSIIIFKRNNTKHASILVAQSSAPKIKQLRYFVYEEWLFQIVNKTRTLVKIISLGLFRTTTTILYLYLEKYFKPISTFMCSLAFYLIEMDKNWALTRKRSRVIAISKPHNMRPKCTQNAPKMHPKCIFNASV